MSDEKINPGDGLRFSVPGAKVAAKLLLVMADVGHLEKDGRNDFHKYDYVSEANAVAHIRKSFIEHGVMAIPQVLEYNIQVLTTKDGNKEKQSALTTILTQYTFIDTESGDTLTAAMLGQGSDAGDKGAYKAATGVNKYVLMKVLQIPTGDDPEADVETDKQERRYPEQVNKDPLIEKITALEKELSSSPDLMTCARDGAKITGPLNKHTLKELRPYYDQLIAQKKARDELAKRFAIEKAVKELESEVYPGLALAAAHAKYLKGATVATADLDDLITYGAHLRKKKESK